MFAFNSCFFGFVIVYTSLCFVYKYTQVIYKACVFNKIRPKYLITCVVGIYLIRGCERPCERTQDLARLVESPELGFPARITAHIEF